MLTQSVKEKKDEALNNFLAVEHDENLFEYVEDVVCLDTNKDDYN